VARDRDGPDAREDFGLLCHREIHGDRATAASPEAPGDEPAHVGAANGGAKEQLALALEAIAAAGNDWRCEAFVKDRGRTGVVAVLVSQEDGSEGAAVGVEFFADSGDGGGEAGVDERELPIIGFDEEDVGAARAVEPPESRREKVSHVATPCESWVWPHGRRGGRRRQWGFWEKEQALRGGPVKSVRTGRLVAGEGFEPPAFGL